MGQAALATIQEDNVRAPLSDIAALIADGLLNVQDVPVRRACAALICLDSLGAAPASVYATAFGCVHLEWNKGNNVLLVEFLSDGTVNIEVNNVQDVSTSVSRFFPSLRTDDLAEIIAETLLTL